MLVKMTKSKFSACEDALLIRACVEPVIQEIRGKSLDIKKAASAGLNENQRALLMFQVLYGHSGNGTRSLFLQLSYMLSERSIWNEFRRSARLFNDDHLYCLYSKLEEVYFGSAGEPTESLDIELSETMPQSVRIAAAFIRNNPELYIRFTD